MNVQSIAIKGDSLIVVSYVLAKYLTSRKFDFVVNDIRKLPNKFDKCYLKHNLKKLFIVDVDHFIDTEMRSFQRDLVRYCHKNDICVKGVYILLILSFKKKKKIQINFEY